MSTNRNNNLEGEKGKAEESEAAYQAENRTKTITISTLEELEELDRRHTAKLSPAQRLEYLRKLNENLFGVDLSRQKAVLREGELIIKKDS